MSDTQPSLPRPEYPRPDRQRDLWQNLNGPWRFAFDDAHEVKAAHWAPGKEPEGTRTITVPFAWQAPLSGVADTGAHDRAWYCRDFDLSDDLATDRRRGQRIFLHFGAVDHEAEVWLNGQLLGRHVGGYTPFAFDVTGPVRAQGNRLVVRVDDRADPIQVRGKQAWYPEPDRCWYVPSSGLWQTVWLEAVGPLAIDRFFATPDIEARTLTLDLELDAEPQGLTQVEVRVRYAGRPAGRVTAEVDRRRVRILLAIGEPDAVDEVHHWTPETPHLYDLELLLTRDGRRCDHLSSAFAMRSIRVVHGRIYLNNKPLYQRLILDQGYWPDGHLTAPTDEAYVRDIELTKALGFNGARKHQKIEDPRYYHWADRLGLLVWGELPSPYEFGRAEIDHVSRDWLAFLARDYNHPCLVTWVPFNESWGVRNIVSDRQQQALAQALVQLARAFDPTRLVSGNDGWECVASDLIGIHDYTGDPAVLADRLAHLADHMSGAFNHWRRTLADGQSWKGEPVLVTEFGGIAFQKDPGWGYSGAVADQEAFLTRFAGTIAALDGSQVLQGWCYTQLTDVFQETNGLADMDRRPKIDPALLRPIIRGEGRRP